MDGQPRPLKGPGATGRPHIIPKRTHTCATQTDGPAAGWLTGLLAARCAAVACRCGSGVAGRFGSGWLVCSGTVTTYEPGAMSDVITSSAVESFDAVAMFVTTVPPFISCTFTAPATVILMTGRRTAVPPYINSTRVTTCGEHIPSPRSTKMLAWLRHNAHSRRPQLQVRVRDTTGRWRRGRRSVGPI